jgi:heme-degrading monooxygenase HmoA
LIGCNKREEVGTMAVRVIIDRKVKRGKAAELSKLLRELRSKAMPAKGYISGETLRSLEDPQNYVVITTWQSADDWKTWERNRERKEIQTKIEKLMSRPTKARIYVYA